MLSPRHTHRTVLAPLLGLFAVLFLSACGTARIAKPVPASKHGESPRAVQSTAGYAYLVSEAAQESARRRLSTLASDAMAGREAGTEGERMAGAFIAGELEAMGVEPGGDMEDGTRSYFQTVPLDTYSFDLDRTGFALAGGPKATTGDDWLAFPTNATDVALSNVPLVFAGYGLADPSQGYDDYADLNVRGAIVLVAAGKPAGIDSVAGIQGDLAADNFLPKYIAAIQRGAAAVAVVADGLLLEGWNAYRNQALSLGMEPRGTPTQSYPVPVIFVHPDFATRLLTETGGPSGAIAQALTGAAIPSFQPKQPATLTLVREMGTAEARNVVGLLPGDEQPDEFVAFGAHYDHLGTIAGEVFNGADDDASGVTTVLAVAEAFAADRRAGNATDRSALFVFHTAEEKGLHGSEFFVSNPDRSVLGDLDRVIAQVNLDMVAREHPDSLYVVGASRLSTTFGRTVETANQALGNDGAPLFTFDFTFDDPDDPENLYQRSDHYSYAKRGVPVVFFTDGMGANWAKSLERDDYHRPDDDIEFIDFAKLVRVARLAYVIGRTTADTDARPDIDQPAGTTP